MLLEETKQGRREYGLGRCLRKRGWTICNQSLMVLFQASRGHCAEARVPYSLLASMNRIFRFQGWKVVAFYTFVPVCMCDVLKCSWLHLPLDWCGSADNLTSATLIPMSGRAASRTQDVFELYTWATLTLHWLNRVHQHACTLEARGKSSVEWLKAPTRLRLTLRCRFVSDKKKGIKKDASRILKCNWVSLRLWERSSWPVNVIRPTALVMNLCSTVLPGSILSSEPHLQEPDIPEIHALSGCVGNKEHPL